MQKAKPVKRLVDVLSHINVPLPLNYAVAKVKILEEDPFNTLTYVSSNYYRSKGFECMTPSAPISKILK